MNRFTMRANGASVVAACLEHLAASGAQHFKVTPDDGVATEVTMVDWPHTIKYWAKSEIDVPAQ
jgi:hypothetical protein